METESVSMASAAIPLVLSKPIRGGVPIEGRHEFVPRHFRNYGRRRDAETALISLEHCRLPPLPGPEWKPINQQILRRNCEAVYGTPKCQLPRKGKAGCIHDLGTHHPQAPGYGFSLHSLRTP